jgi:predicted ATP-grasp superfamily ATP-dependent carboligase
MVVSATFRLRAPVDWTDSLVLVAFPTTGNAGNIAGHYVRKNLGLPLIGSVHLEDAPGMVAVENGVATSPIRIFGGEVECKLGAGSCPTVHLIVTDLPLDAKGMSDLTKAITTETKGCSLVMALDAVERDAEDDNPGVYAAAADDKLLGELLSEHVTKLAGGILVGMSGYILAAADRGELPGGALLVEAAKGVPDGHAAATLVKAIDRLIPQIRMDMEPLRAEAEELERMVQKAQKVAERRDSWAPYSSYI